MKTSDLVVGALVGVAAYIALVALANRARVLEQGGAAWVPRWNPLNGALITAGNDGTAPGAYS